MNGLTIEKVAEIAHEIGRAYSISIGEDKPHWSMLPDNEQAGVIKGVGFYLDNPNATPEDLHKNWMKDKIQDGWIYGETKNSQQKIHPCLIPYEKLPQEQRSKDYIFAATIANLKNMIHYGD